MRRHPEAAQPADVVDDVARFTGQRIRGLGQADRHVVAAARADLDAVETQHAVAIDRRIGRPGGIAVVGEHDERKTRSRGGGGDRFWRARSVRSIGVDVDGARDRAVAPRRLEDERLIGAGDEAEKNNGGHQGRRYQQYAFHR
jgi:hypothetical protein